MLDNVVSILSEHISNPYMLVVLISAIPILESRFSIPYGILILKLPWYNVVLVSIAANFAVTVPIIYLLDPISKYLQGYSVFDRFFKWLFSRSERKGKIIDRLKVLGLILFVGIPLPITGAWSGCVAAYIFGLKKSHTLIGVFIGILLSVLIIASLSLTGKAVFN